MKIAVVIPCYRVTNHVLDVIAGIDDYVDRIYVVDDGCPDRSGELVEKQCSDERVRVIVHEHNQGVGGAVTTGYWAAYDEGYDVIVKVDGDGQMDPALIPRFCQPILDGLADYTKGNRFFNIENVRRMPGHRILGNAVLSFFSKISSGYWNIFDPTNGYTAIRASLMSQLRKDKIRKDYFFESDIMFHLYNLRCVVRDVPMVARYGDEQSSLQVSRILFPYMRGHLGNFFKRMFYSYFLRGFSLASVEIVVGVILLTSGSMLGIVKWIEASASDSFTSSGTVMLAALPILLGFLLLMSALNFDMTNEPRVPIGTALDNDRRVAK